MSKTKRLTDEEIVKAFEYCANNKRSCKPCPYCFSENGELRCKSKQRNKDILDIIYHLKEQNEKLIKAAEDTYQGAGLEIDNVEV